jgi:hypothetical protein
MTELEMLRLANEGHVKLIAKLAAERDKIKRELETARKALGVKDE